MRKTVEIYQPSVTVGDLKKLISALPEDIADSVKVGVNVAERFNNPTDPGGEIRIRVEWTT